MRKALWVAHATHGQGRLRSTQHLLECGSVEPCSAWKDSSVLCDFWPSLCHYEKAPTFSRFQSSMTVQKTAELHQAVKCKKSKDKRIDFYDLGSVHKIKIRSGWISEPDGCLGKCADAHGRWRRTTSIFCRRRGAKRERFFPY